MAVEVMVPRLGWSMESGVFGQWLKQDGDAVAVGEPVFTIEGEKATEEVESEDAGVLHIRPGVAEPGVELTVGTVIGWLLAEGEVVPEAPPDPAAKAGAESAAKPETDPGAAQPGVTPSGPPPAATAAVPAAKPVAAARGQRSDGRIASSPRARRIARELGVDWRLASGSGKGGRIRERDVRALAAGRGADGVAPAAAAPPPDLGTWGPVETVPLSAARRQAVARLTTVAQTVPMATQLGAADVTRLEALRERYGSRAREAGGTLTMAAMLAKVAASALKIFPQLNGSLDLAAGRLVRRGYYHVGIAVDTEHGTSFPVVRDADRKNMLQLSVEIADLAARARRRHAGARRDARGLLLDLRARRRRRRRHRPLHPAGQRAGSGDPGRIPRAARAGARRELPHRRAPAADAALVDVRHPCNRRHGRHALPALDHRRHGGAAAAAARRVSAPTPPRRPPMT